MFQAFFLIRRGPIIAVSELLYPKPRMLSGFFNKKKPPLNEA